MKNINKAIKKNISKKAHMPDPAKNDQFHRENTPVVKVHKEKVPHGKFHGKRWFPQ